MRPFARRPAAFAVIATLAIGSGGALLHARSAGRARIEEGRRIFSERCALCHASGARAAQGPGLGGVVGRKAAATRFSYSPALRASGLTWDTTTLDRFLEAPSKAVPGTTMPMPVPDPTERRSLIEYLATLPPADSPFRAADRHPPAPIPPAPPGLRTGREAFGDYRGDGPGVRRRITADDMPPPNATPSARNAPEVVRPPPGAAPALPEGFTADEFAGDLQGPRLLRVAPSGDLFVAESEAGRVRVLRARDGAPRAEASAIFAKGLDRPFGIAFYPPGPDPAWVYVAEANRVLRFPYRNGDLEARAAPETIVASLTRTPAGHWTRDVAFTNDGARMFVSVGSASNVAEGRADETDRADVLVFDPQGHGKEVFASGIRNCVGLAVRGPRSDVWCSTNERDGLGDDLAPDYVSRVREGGFYGWPWFYIGAHPDPRRAGERPELATRVIVPDVLLQPHSAPLGIAFYDAATFPPKYRGCAFVALHGSWNRSKRTGPKVVAVLMKDGDPTGEYEDFMTGFVVDDDSVWARPVGVAGARDGALFVSEDGNGTVWRVRFGG